MKTKISLIMVLCVVMIAIGCNASFNSANISSFNFGKNQTTTPPATTFDAGEKIFAVANVANAMGKFKMKFNVTVENVQGQTKGTSAFTKAIDFEGAVPVGLSLTLPTAGEYKVEAILSDEDGKELDKKSGNITVKGGAPAPTDAKKADDEDSDDKATDK